MTPCPAADTLARFLADDLPAAEAEATRDHVRGCPACQAALDDLSDDADLRRAAHRPPGPEGPALRRALAALRAAPPDLLGDDTPAPAAGKPLPFFGPPARPGDLGTLGPYQVEAEIGRGGMGLVFRARDPALARVVAVKMLRPGFDDTARRRLVREARAAAQCRHDHLVVVHAVVDPPDGPPYLVMEHLAGPTLAALIREGGPLVPARATALVAQVADGLVAAHAAGLVHRDVKPGNILLDPATGRAKLADFGLARDLSAGTTLEGAVAGTPAYLSPEQADGRTAGSAASDVYALGVTLYEALTGDVPFRGAPQMVLRQLAQDEPWPPRRLNDRVPRDLETVCLKAMAKEPARRYTSAAEFRDDLRRFLAGKPVRARPTGPVGRGARWCRRRPTLAALTASLVLALAVGGTGVVWQWRRAEAAAAAARERTEDSAEQRRRAEASLRDALAVVDQYLTTVSEARLFNEPGAQPLRKELLTKARDFYQRFTEEHRDDAGLARELARAQFRLGNVVFLLDGPAPAAAELEKAVALQERLAADHPDDPTCRLELGQTLISLGVCYVNGGRPGDALACYDRALAGVVPAPPGAAAADTRLLEARARTGRARALSQKRQWAEEEAEFSRAVALARELVEAGARLPKSRRTLAVACNDLGDLYRFLGRADEADAALAGAVAAWEALLREAPGDLSAPEGLARSLKNLGDVRLTRRRPGEAVPYYRRAVPILTPLVRDNPAVADFPIALAWVHNSLGVCAELEGRWSDALAAFREGQAVLRAAPEPVRRQAAVGAALSLRVNLAHCLSDGGEESAAFAEYDRAMRDVADGFPGSEPSAARRGLLCGLHSRRALAALRWGRWADAVAEYDAALANDTGRSTHLLRVLRAWAAGRVPGAAAPSIADDYAAAMAELDRFDTGEVMTGTQLYAAALVCATSRTATARDTTLDPAERARRVAAYADRAVAFLGRARASGYFHLPGLDGVLKSDRAWEPLRARADFQALLN